MKKHECNVIVKNSKKYCFEEDKKVMLDESIMRMKGGIFYIYDLIFFGNKIVISTETMKKIKRFKNRVTYKIYSNNCKYLLENIEKDSHGNYEFVDIDVYEGSKVSKLIHYLREHENVIYLLTNRRLYEKLTIIGLKNRIMLLDENMKYPSLCKNHSVMFVTLGLVQHKESRMFFERNSGETLVKVYSKSGEEKQFDKSIEIEVGDIIFTRSDKEMKYSFNIYQIVTRHSRNFAVRIIWTDLLKGEKTNFYVKRLDYIYQKMIEDNS